MKNSACLVVAAMAFSFISASSFAKADEPDTTEKPKPAKRSGIKLPKYGLELSLYQPTNSATKALFGKDWTSWDIAIGSVVSKPGFTIQPNLNFLSNRSSRGASANAFFAMLSVEGRYAFTNWREFEGAEPKFRAINPYAGASVDIMYYNIDAPTVSIKTRKFGFGGTVFAGTTLGKNFYSEVRYHFIPEIKSYDFSGLRFNIGFRF